MTLKEIKGRLTKHVSVATTPHFDRKPPSVKPSDLMYVVIPAKQTTQEHLHCKRKKEREKRGELPVLRKTIPSIWKAFSEPGRCTVTFILSSTHPHLAVPRRDPLFCPCDSDGDSLFPAAHCLPTMLHLLHFALGSLHGAGPPVKTDFQAVTGHFIRHNVAVQWPV